MTAMGRHNSDRVNPAAMTVDEAAAALQVTAQTVEEHIAAGLPVTKTDAGVRIHLVEYVAWMAGQVT